MLFILEVILTVAAWRKGWKSMAMLPIGLVITLSLILALGLRLDPGDHVGLFVSMDLIATCVLGVMARRAPRPAQEAASEPMAAALPLPEHN